MTTLTWNTDERDQAALIARSINDCSDTSAHPLPQRAICFLLEDVGDMIDGLHEVEGVPNPTGSVSLPFLPMRHLFRLLGFDESWPFRWRLEHKLVQALTLHHYCPGAIPVTCGLNRYLAGQSHSKETTDELARNYIKPTLGYAGKPQTTEEIKRTLDSFLLGYSHSGIPTTIKDEQWIIQERIDIQEEYRVHSIEDSVVEDLTYLRHTGRPIRTERDKVNTYVATLLSRLPKAFVSNAVCGWDIAQDRDHRYCVVEVNFAGRYPYPPRGFQCSGFFAQPGWGPAVFARFLRFVEWKYGTTISFRDLTTAPTEIRYLYWWIARWFDVGRIPAAIQDLEAAMSVWESPDVPNLIRKRYGPAADAFSHLLRGMKSGTTR